jgi:PAS domain S-box-containing protein
MPTVRYADMLRRALPRRLHVQLALLFGLLFAVSLGIYADYTANEQGDAVLELLRQHTQALGDNIAAQVGESLRPGADGNTLASTLHHWSAFPGLVSLVIVGADGSRLATFHSRGESERQVAGDEDPATPPDHGQTTVVAAGAGRPERIVAWAPIGATHSQGWLRIEADTRPARAARAHILQDSLMMAVFMSAVATLAVAVFLRRPIRAIRRAAAFASDLDENFGMTMPVETGPEETQTLVRALNRTSQQLAEQHAAIVEGEMRKSAILDAALDAVITFAADGRVLEFNVAAETMLGYDRAEACDRNVFRLLFAEEDQLAYSVGLEQHRSGGRSEVVGRYLDIIAVRKDGSRFPAELAITALQLGGRSLYTASLRDRGTCRPAHGASAAKSPA